MLETTCNLTSAAYQIIKKVSWSSLCDLYREREQIGENKRNWRDGEVRERDGEAMRKERKTDRQKERGRERERERD